MAARSGSPGGGAAAVQLPPASSQDEPKATLLDLLNHCEGVLLLEILAALGKTVYSTEMISKMKWASPYTEKGAMCYRNPGRALIRTARGFFVDPPAGQRRAQREAVLAVMVLYDSVYPPVDVDRWSYEMQPDTGRLKDVLIPNTVAYFREKSVYDFFAVERTETVQLRTTRSCAATGATTKCRQVSNEDKRRPAICAILRKALTMFEDTVAGSYYYCIERRPAPQYTRMHLALQHLFGGTYELAYDKLNFLRKDKFEIDDFPYLHDDVGLRELAVMRFGVPAVFYFDLNMTGYQCQWPRLHDADERAAPLRLRRNWSRHHDVGLLVKLLHNRPELRRTILNCEDIFYKFVLHNLRAPPYHDDRDEWSGTPADGTIDPLVLNEFIKQEPALLLQLTSLCVASLHALSRCAHGTPATTAGCHFVRVANSHGDFRDINCTETNRSVDSVGNHGTHGNAQKHIAVDFVRRATLSTAPYPLLVMRLRNNLEHVLDGLLRIAQDGTTLKDAILETLRSSGGTQQVMMCLCNWYAAERGAPHKQHGPSYMFCEELSDLFFQDDAALRAVLLIDTEFHGAMGRAMRALAYQLLLQRGTMSSWPWPGDGHFSGGGRDLLHHAQKDGNWSRTKIVRLDRDRDIWTAQLIEDVLCNILKWHHLGRVGPPGGDFLSLGHEQAAFVLVKQAPSALLPDPAEYVGQRIEVLHVTLRRWFAGVVQAYDSATCRHRILYDLETLHAQDTWFHQDVHLPGVKWRRINSAGKPVDFFGKVDYLEDMLHWVVTEDGVLRCANQPLAHTKRSSVPKTIFVLRPETMDKLGFDGTPTPQQLFPSGEEVAHNMHKRLPRSGATCGAFIYPTHLNDPDNIDKLMEERSFATKSAVTVTMPLFAAYCIPDMFVYEVMRFYADYICAENGPSELCSDQAKWIREEVTEAQRMNGGVRGGNFPKHLWTKAFREWSRYLRDNPEERVFK